MTVRRLSVLLNAKPATPPERVAGVAPVEVQKGTRPEVSEEEVAIGEEPELAPVMVNGVEPMVTNGLQDTVPEQDTVVVGTAVMRSAELPISRRPAGNVVVPVPPWGTVSCADAAKGTRAATAIPNAMSSFFIIKLCRI